MPDASAGTLETWSSVHCASGDPANDARVELLALGVGTSYFVAEVTQTKPTAFAATYCGVEAFPNNVGRWNFDDSPTGTGPFGMLAYVGNPTRQDLISNMQATKGAMTIGTSPIGCTFSP
jgi:hypothetical protein